MADHKTLYLELDDEITSVVEKVRNTDATNLTIVIPKNAVLLQSIVNLKILRRVAEKRKKRLAVVTADKGARNLISRAGLPLKRKIGDPFPEESPEDIEESAIQQETKATEAVTADSSEPEELEGGGEVSIVGQATTTDDKRKEVDESEEDATVEEEEVGDLHVKTYKQPAGDQPERTKPSEDEDRKQTIESIKSRRAKQAKKKSMPSSFVKIGSLVGGIVLIIVAGVLYFTLASAKVRIVPQSEPASDTINVSVVTEGSVNDLLTEASGRVLTKDSEEIQTFDATGEEDFGEKATGTVTIRNTFSSDPQPLVAGTRFSTPSGLVYLLNADTSVPGATIQGGNTVAGQITVNATASDLGDKYNIGATNLTIPGLSAAKQAEITASTDGFDGGSSDVQSVVTAEDIAKAKEELNDKTRDKAKEELKSEVEDGQVLLDEAIAVELLESTPTVAAGDQADSFDLRVVARATGVSYNEEEVQRAALNELKERLEGEKSFVEDGTESFNTVVDTFNAEKSSLIVSTIVEKTVIPELSTDDFAKEIRGKSEVEILQYFAENSDIESAEVDLWPFWVKKAPNNTEKIEIILDTN